MTELTRFDRAFIYTLETEKGFVFDPRDPGGPTKYGITQATLSRWRKAPISVQDVKDLQLAEAKTIYKAWYWDPNALPEIAEAGVAIAMFDAGVLFGIREAATAAQRSAIPTVLARPVVIDGHIGVISVNAINHTHPVLFIQAFQKLLKDHVKDIIAARPKSAAFEKGWLARIDKYKDLVQI